MKNLNSLAWRGLFLLCAINFVTATSLVANPPDDPVDGEKSVLTPESQATIKKLMMQELTFKLPNAKFSEMGKGAYLHDSEMLLPYGGHRKLEITEAETKRLLSKLGGLLQFGETLPDGERAILQGKDGFKNLAEEEQAALVALAKKLKKVYEPLRSNTKVLQSYPGWAKDYFSVYKDMEKIAGMGEKTQEFLEKYFGEKGKRAAQKGRDNKSIEEVEAALKASSQFADFRDMARQVDNDRLRMTALKNQMEASATGFYLQMQLESLIGSKEFCDALEECKKSPAERKGPKLDGLFDRKSHGK